MIIKRYHRSLFTLYEAMMSIIGIKQNTVCHVRLTGPLAGMRMLIYGSYLALSRRVAARTNANQKDRLCHTVGSCSRCRVSCHALFLPGFPARSALAECMKKKIKRLPLKPLFSCFGNKPSQGFVNVQRASNELLIINHVAPRVKDTCKLQKIYSFEDD